MSSITLFILSIISIALVSMAFVFKKREKAIDYFKTDQGKGVLKGIILFVVFGAVLAAGSKVFAGEGGTWFKYGEVYLGLDNTNKMSPMCEKGNNSSRLTSNGGLRLNIYQSGDKRFDLNSKYTHHSCAYNSDNKSYDALGIEATYKLWVK